MFVKIGDFIKFKGFLVKTGAPEKIKRAQKIAQKGGLSEPRLLQCT